MNPRETRRARPERRTRAVEGRPTTALSALSPLQKRMIVAIWREMSDMKTKKTTLDKLMPSIMDKSDLTRDDFRREGVGWMNRTGILYITTGEEDIFQRTLSYLGPTRGEEATIRAMYRALVEAKKGVTFDYLAVLKSEEVIAPKPARVKPPQKTVNFDDLPFEERIYHIVTSDREWFNLNYKEEYEKEMPAFMDQIHKNAIFKRMWDERLKVFADLMLDRIKKKSEGAPVLFIPVLSLDRREITYGPDNVVANRRTRIEPVAEKEKKVEDLVENLRINDAVPSTIVPPSNRGTQSSVCRSQSGNPPKEGDSNTTFIVTSPIAARSGNRRFFVLPEISTPHETPPPSSADLRQEMISQSHTDAPVCPEPAQIMNARSENLRRSDYRLSAEPRPSRQTAQAATATARTWNCPVEINTISTRNVTVVPRSRDVVSLPPPVVQQGYQGTAQPASSSESRRAASVAPRPREQLNFSGEAIPARNESYDDLMQTVWEGPEMYRHHDSFIPRLPPPPNRLEVSEERLPERDDVHCTVAPSDSVRAEAVVEHQPSTTMHRSSTPFIARPPESISELPQSTDLPALPARNESSENLMQTTWEGPEMYRHHNSFIPRRAPPPNRLEERLPRFPERNDVIVAPSFSVELQPSTTMHRSSTPFIARSPESIHVLPQSADLPPPVPRRQSSQPAPVRRGRSPERNHDHHYLGSSASAQPGGVLPPPAVLPQRLGNPVSAISSHRTLQMPQEPHHLSGLPSQFYRLPPAVTRTVRSSERNDAHRSVAPPVVVQEAVVPQPPVARQRLENPVLAVSSHHFPQVHQQHPQPTVLPQPVPRRQSQPHPIRRAHSPEASLSSSQHDRPRPPEVAHPRPVTPSSPPISLNALVECTVEFLAFRYPRGATLNELRTMWEDWSRISFEGKTAETLTALRHEGVLTFKGSSFALANIQRWWEIFPRMQALEEAALTAYLADIVEEGLRNANPVNLRDLDLDIPIGKFDSLPLLFPDRFRLIHSGVIALVSPVIA